MANSSVVDSEMESELDRLEAKLSAMPAELQERAWSIHSRLLDVMREDFAAAIVAIDLINAGVTMELDARQLIRT